MIILVSNRKRKTKGYTNPNEKLRVALESPCAAQDEPIWSDTDDVYTGRPARTYTEIYLPC